MNGGHSYTKKIGSVQGIHFQPRISLGKQKSRGFFNTIKKVFELKSSDKHEAFSSEDVFKNTTEMGNADVKPNQNYVLRKNKNAVVSENLSLQYLPRKVPAPCGLVNLGNTCYLNAIIQCLRAIRPLRHFCLNKHYETSVSVPLGCNEAVFHEFVNLISKMHLTTSRVVGYRSIQRFKHAFAQFAPPYCGNLQQDALEFFSYLFNILRDETKGRSSVSSFSCHTLGFNDTQINSTILPVSPGYQKRRLRIGGLKTACNDNNTSSTEEVISGADDFDHQSSSLSSSLSSEKLSTIARRGKKKRAVSSKRIDQSLVDEKPLIDAAGGSDNSFLMDIFVGKLQTQLRCCECNNVTTKKEVFWNLPLCVPKPKDAETEDASEPQTPLPITLKDCFETFTKVDVLDGSDKLICERCQKRTKTEIHVLISRLPDVLVLQFQRFDATCFKNKRCHLIDFDLDLDVAKYTTKHRETEAEMPESVSVEPQGAGIASKCICSPAIKSSGVEGDVSDTKPSPPSSGISSLPSSAPLKTELAFGGTQYRLIGVVYHQGGTQHGHYTARCRSFRRNKWYLFDDESVRPVANPKDVIRPTAYILFYERIEGIQTDLEEDPTAVGRNAADNHLKVTAL